ncbi:MAG TPA: aldehyde dehydrogenase family protein [Dermatophilaceae bacterium]|nr:aldehyde dehydrogenase family protein [Dermatophilaceae bacterium]HPK89226.1 aldehyde dehydrogenase family protein [Dermatophilaceae bacterium]
MSTHVEVRKTYKLYIGGNFPRSESGRSYAVHAAPSRSGRPGAFLANAAAGSRKDARDAVVAARGAFPKWAGATAYNRGQVLYRVAEVMQGRAAQFEQEVAAAEGLTAARARATVEAAIDRWVWYAGWSDKLAQVLGGLNPVAGPYFDISAPEPTGVVAVLAPQASSLLGLVSVLAPVIVSGNTAVLVASQDRPLPAVTLTECLATSDVPGGVVNVITGRTAEIAPWLASHRDVNAIDLAGATDGSNTAATADGKAVTWGDLERAAADNLKRVLRPAGSGAAAVEPDWAPTPDLSRMTAFLETKTVWHPKGR